MYLMCLLRFLVVSVVVSASLATGVAQETMARWVFDLTSEACRAPFTVERGHGVEPESEGARFSVAVPEGNYRVSVTLGDPRIAGDTTIKAETRRLMVERIVTAAGESVVRTFVVNIRDGRLRPPGKNAPGGDRVALNDRERGALHWDDKLTLEFVGPRPVARRIEIERVEVPTVFLLGDSTVTDQPLEPNASWGQMLPRFFGPDIAVANHAESGETLKSFVTGLRLAKVLELMREGDWVLIQFGHNDSKRQWPQTWADAASTYRAYLRVFIAEVRLRGATPVLVTPVERRNFDDAGRIVRSHGDYPAAVHAVAAEEGVALIDLEAMSCAIYEALGEKRAALAFAGGGHDRTHHNTYGAYQLARAVLQGIRDAELPLARHLAGDTDVFDPHRPDAPETFALAPSPGPAMSVRPRGD